MIGVTLFTGGNILGDLMGIFAAHMFYFLVDVKGYNLKAPKIL